MEDAARELLVSTHSRLKAAGHRHALNVELRRGFNTQPPEGGWGITVEDCATVSNRFNTQPPEGGWATPAQRRGWK